MNTDFVTSAGYFQKLQYKKNRQGQAFSEFSLRDAIRQILNQIHVEYYDCNCVPSEPSGFPVRMKSDKSGLEYFDGDTQEWTDVS